MFRLPGVQAPRFEVDPLWPKPLPNHWVIGQTIGLDVDSNDNVWIIHRPGTFDSSGKETYAMTDPRQRGDAASPRRTFSNSTPPAISSVTGAKPKAMTGQSRTTASRSSRMAPSGWAPMAAVRLHRLPERQPQPGRGAAPPPQVAQQLVRGAGRGAGRAGAPRRRGAEAGVATGGGQYHDSFILHFTQDGKWLGEIGGANMNKGSNDTERSARRG